MQRQDVCSAVSIASPHKPLLVVKCSLKRLEDTAWLSLIKWLWGCMTSRQRSSETQLVKTHGRVALSSLVFHKRALWHSPRRSRVFCLAPTHPAFHNSATPPPSLADRNQSHSLLCQLFLNTLLCWETRRVLLHLRTSNRFWESHPLEGFLNPGMP